MVSDQITDANPGADFRNGGSILEWNKSLDGVLALDFDMAIPGRGEPKTRDDVQAFRTKMATLITRCNEAMNAEGHPGHTRDAGEYADHRMQRSYAGSFAGIYDEITKKGA